MKKLLLPSIIIVLIILIFLGFTGFTGKTISDSGPGQIGPNQEEQNCMFACVSVGCNEGDTACMESHGDECMTECGVVMPDQTEDEKCVETCIQEGCDKYDFNCQTKNQEKCDEECGMITDPGAQSKEEQCIRDCVAKVDPTLMCGNSQEGETGNDVCQKCAQECVYLYAGPCLNDEEITEKESACETCEHCYGEPAMGDSGEGYQCIIDINCEDASDEFGDEPGIGPGIEKLTNNVVNFFKNLFGINDESKESSRSSEEPPEVEERITEPEAT